MPSSKDLEKDEREAMGAAVKLLPGAESEGIAYGEHVWLQACDYWQARLQQVEAGLERERVLRQDALEYQDGAESRVSRAEAELSIAREALAELVRLKHHPDHDRLTAEKQAAWSRAHEIVARLQAKEEGTNG